MEFETYEDVIDSYNSGVGVEAGETLTDYIKRNNIKSKFIGKNFVFDHRLGERVTKNIISNCHQCNESSDNHTNCINQACHILFIQCEECSKKYNNCCSKECTEFIQLPKEEQKRIFKEGKIKFTAQKSSRVKPKLYDI